MKDDIIQIEVYDLEAHRCIASTDAGEIDRIIAGTDDDVWFHAAISDPTIHIFSIPYYENGDSEYRVNVSKQIKYKNGSRTGILRIEISFQRFIELLDKSNLGEGGHITIVDPDYVIVYTSHSKPDSITNEIDVIREIMLGSKNVVLGGYNMNVNVDTLSNTNWRICTFVNVDIVRQIEQNFKFTTLFISIIILIIGIFLFMVVVRIITSPIKKLELAMRKVEKEDYFSVEKVDIIASKEVEDLIQRFNKMMLKINELMNHVIENQDVLRKSELKALQNQIIPHFLYNTLDLIIWMIENHKNEEAGEMIVALARIFRIGISNGSEVIPVSSEIEHVRNYLLIQNKRYADSFTYEFDLDEAAMSAKTMKLILQPIVENCLNHGLKNKIDMGSIHIRAYIEGDYLALSVSDNGYGMRKETIDAIYKSFEDGTVGKGVGLKNIYQRIMTYYDGNAEQKIESKLDNGTTITIKEPLNRE